MRALTLAMRSLAEATMHSLRWTNSEPRSSVEKKHETNVSKTKHSRHKW